MIYPINPPILDLLDALLQNVNFFKTLNPQSVPSRRLELWEGSLMKFQCEKAIVFGSASGTNGPFYRRTIVFNQVIQQKRQNNGIRFFYFHERFQLLSPTVIWSHLMTCDVVVDLRKGLAFSDFCDRNRPRHRPK